MCGGPREASTIRRTLLDGQCSRACEIRGDELRAISLLPQTGAHTANPFAVSRASYRCEHHKIVSGDLCDHSVLCGFEHGVHQNKNVWLLLASFVLTACYSDLKPGVIKIVILGCFWRPL